MVGGVQYAGSCWHVQHGLLLCPGFCSMDAAAQQQGGICMVVLYCTARL
jgi:hypothetical protein